MFFVLVSMMLFVVSPVSAEESSGENNFKKYQLYFRASGDMGLSYGLQGTRNVTESDPDSATGTKSTTEAERLYTAKDEGNGVALDAGFSWNPDYLFGTDTRWNGRSCLMAGPALMWRYIASGESNCMQTGLVLDTTILWVLQFYIGGLYTSYSSPMYYVSGFSYTTHKPLFDKKSISGVGLIIGGGVDYPVTDSISAFVFIDYYQLNVDGDKQFLTGNEYDDYSWARVGMRFGASFRIDL
jgi:hypothetical protein